MIDSSLSLTPDDGQQEHIDLQEQSHALEQPYGLVAWSIGLLALLLLRGALHHVQAYTLVGATLIIVTFMYLLLSGLRPKLPLLAVVILAAELGLFYSLPYKLLYLTIWQDSYIALNMLIWIALAGLIGVLLSRGLDAERYPAETIGISFLVMFVFVNLVYTLPML